MLDGAQKLKPMIEAAIRDGQPAIATTDHGNVYSLIEFYQECKKQGIKPILGTEAYMARNSVDERPKMRKKKNEEGGETEEGSKLYHHLTVLAENNTGYQNLIKLSSRAYLEGFYYKPRIDWDILSDHSEGLIVTTGCLGGIVLQELLQDRPQEALRAAGRLQDILGRDNLFVELQDHGIPEQARTNPGLIEISKKLGAPLVVTNDAHYVARSDAHAHDVLLCCNTHAKIHETDRFKFHGEEHYLKTAREMGLLFPDYPEACSNTLLVGERCDVQIEFGKNLVPRFPVPDRFESEDEYLRHLVTEGAQERWAITDEVVNRLDYELETICNMGMAGYFLILWDLCRHAHKVGIRIGPARGSAGGCAVAYCLRITDVDPLRWGLLFERFLNPARVSMPDIDLDIPGRFRDHMINYTREKYGDDRVCQIITFSQIRSRNAVRDAARVLDKPLSLGDKIAKALPPLVFGRDTPLSACLEKEEGYEDGYVRADQFRSLYNNDNEAKEVVDAAIGIEGLHKSDGIHAAAVVIAPGPLTDYVPVQRKPNKGKEGPLTTQYEMNAVESLGLLKMDYLGLKTLDIISDAVDLIKKRTGLEINLSGLDFNDAATFALLKAGQTLGVFQLESAPMRDLLRRLKPDTLEDIAAVLALYRPGPMAANMHNAYADRKNGLEEAEPFHEDVRDLLEETHQLMVYQEQLMAVSQKLAGYALADGYQLVKTCAKKIPEAMEAERSKFTEGMINKGYDSDFATDVFGMVADFANYAFNKCVTGDTVVIDGNSHERTVKELWDRSRTIGEVGDTDPSRPCLWCGKVDLPRSRGLCRGCKAWHYKFHNYGIKLLALDSDGRIRPRALRDVHFNGMKKVFKVTLANGHEITATGNHRHLTPDGYCFVDELLVGDFLVTHEGVDSVSRFTKEDARVTSGERSQTGVVNKAFLDENYGYIDGGHAMLQAWTKGAPNHCEIDPAHKGRLERSHLDGNRKNNHPDNLSMMCASCHKKHDYRVNGRAKQWEKGHLTGKSEIISIEDMGMAPVYDVEMASTEHNYVANGIVTHNSHSYGYGYITYWTAYLKANYPVEFMTACLTNAAESDRLGIVLQETRELGIEVLPPDVNVSQREFAPVNDNQISFGLGSIRGVGDEPADDIVVEREQNGNYKDFFDYVHRSSRKAMNSKIIEGMIYAGAFSGLGHPRRGLASIFKEVIQQEQKDRSNAGAGAISLFDVETYYESQGVPDLEYKPIELLDFERKYLGVWLTGHPLEGLTEEVELASDLSLAELADMPEIDWRRRTRIAGIVVNMTERITRKGDPMKTFDIQDLGASIPCVLFPNATRQYGHMVNEGDVLALTVNPQDDRSGMKLVVEQVEQLRRNTLQRIGNIHLFLPDDYPVDTLKHQLKQTTGDSSVFMHWLGQSVKFDARTTFEAVKEVLRPTGDN